MNKDTQAPSAEALPLRAFTKAVPERQHHIYSPSSLQMREACSCFQNRSGSNEAAIAGTLQHEVTETGKDNNTLDDEQVLAAADCIDFSERQKQLFVEERERAQVELAKFVDVFPEVIDLVEAYLPIDDCKFTDYRTVEKTDAAGRRMLVQEQLDTESTTAGYVDRALVNWDRTRAVLIDFKFGAFDAASNPENSLQAISYVLGIFKMFPSVNEVAFYFKQPKLDLVTKAVFTRGQLADLYLRVQVVVARAREADNRVQRDDWSMATPRTPACLFCNRIGSCPKVAAIALNVGSKFYPLEIPSDIDPTGLKSDQDAAFGIRLSTVLAVWSKSFRAQVSDRCIRGEAPLPAGYRIETRSDREVVDKAKFKEISLRLLTTAELEELAEYTFGGVEKAISAKAPRGNKKASVEDFQAALMTEGAVKRGQPYSFLKVSGKSE